MEKLLKGFMLYVLTCLVVSPAFGEIIHVPNDQPTIRAGIDAATNGDIVEVADGTYTGEGNRNLDFGGKAITLKSQNGPENCIIDGEYAYPIQRRGFHFHNGEYEDSVVNGFTITGFTDRGIYIENSSPTINNCIFSDNVSDHDGAALFNSGLSTTVTNCTFSNNGDEPDDYGSLSGGAIYNTGTLTVTNSTFMRNWTSGLPGGAIYSTGIVTVTNCAFSFNNSSERWGVGNGGAIANTGSLTVSNSKFNINYGGERGGGAISSYSDSSAASATITNSTFFGNYTFSTQIGGGGAIRIDNSSATITNCDFSGNRGSDGGAIFTNSSTIVTNCTFTGNLAGLEEEVSGGAITASNATITNCILWDNRSFDGSQIVGDSSTVVTYSDIEGGYAGADNIDADPLFVDPGFWDDQGTPYHWDDIFRTDNWPQPPDNHLQVNSPSIDSATATDAPDTDLEGISRPQGSGYDMGAYEYVFNMPDIIDFFDASVSDGTIYGRGTVLWLANMRLSIFGIMLETAGDFIEQDNIKRACKQLNRIEKLCDNEPMPQDFILGPAVPELADMILDLKGSTECN